MIYSLLSFFFLILSLFSQTAAVTDEQRFYQLHHIIYVVAKDTVVFPNSWCIYVLMFIVRVKKRKARPATRLSDAVETLSAQLRSSLVLQTVASWKMDESLLGIRHFFSLCRTMWQWFLRRFRPTDGQRAQDELMEEKKKLSQKKQRALFKCDELEFKVLPDKRPEKCSLSVRVCETESSNYRGLEKVSPARQY